MVYELRAEEHSKPIEAAGRMSRTNVKDQWPSNDRGTIRPQVMLSSWPHCRIPLVLERIAIRNRRLSTKPNSIFKVTRR